MKKTIILYFSLILSINLIAQTAQKRVNVQIIGNSISAGQGSSRAETFPYSAQLARLLGGNYNVGNSAVSGQTTQQISAAYTTQVGNFYDASTYSKNIAVILEARNDMINNSLTPTQAYNNLVTLCNTTRAQGWKVIVITITPSWSATYKGDATVTGYNNLETDRLALNALIVANWATFADALVDFGANSFVGTTAKNEQSGYTFSTSVRPTANNYYIDGTHFLNTGYGLLAEMVHQSILKLL